MGNLFFALSFVVAIVSILVPFLVVRVFAKKWSVDPRYFWKAGVAGIIIAALILGVSLNIGGAIPAFPELPVVAQALILALFSGLFVELGRFMVLDRMMIKVRNRESAVIFGMGWSGVWIICMGFIMAFGVFGMQNLANLKDLRSTMPDASDEQIQILMESQKQIQLLVEGSPLKAFDPLLENFAIVLFDIGLTLLIVLGLRKKSTANTWIAVGIRSSLGFLVFYNLRENIIPIEVIYGLWIFVGSLLIFFVQKKFPKSELKV